MRLRVATVVLLACGACTVDPRAATESVIFGADDRIEVYEVTDDALRDAVTRAVPAMITRSRVRIDAATGIVTITGPALGPSHDLCDGEAHVEQPSSASCSATLIDDDLVLTAGHCVESLTCANQRYVFGFYYDAPGALRTIDVSEVYSCAEIVAFEHSADNDIAIVRLDRPAPGPPLEVRRTPAVVGESTSLAGYPLGLPMKVVESGPVTRIQSATRFYARLDAHPGNSGSGVFDASLRVLGELTNGPVDAYVMDGTCQRLRVIGEDTTRTETINSVLPAIDLLCGSGFPSERLCGAVCGDAVCSDGEVCEADCPLDAGAPDASLVPDAPSARDSGDVAAPDAPGDSTRTPRGGGCTCRAHESGAGSGRGLAWLASALLVARARRSAPARAPAAPEPSVARAR